jgi:hypothetical protein
MVGHTENQYPVKRTSEILHPFLSCNLISTISGSIPNVNFAMLAVMNKINISSTSLKKNGPVVQCPSLPANAEDPTLLCGDECVRVCFGGFRNFNLP